MILEARDFKLCEVHRNSNISNYLDILELELDNNDNEQSQIVNNDLKPKSKILSLFKKYRK